jgi:hypothetical protein
VALVLAACGDDGGDSPFPPRPAHTGTAPPALRIVGNWAGLVKSKDGATYTAEISVKPAAGGSYTGRTVYPGLQCAGDLTGSRESPGVYRFTETITLNKALCSQDQWHIVVDLLKNPRTSEWRWSGPGEAFGTLRRASAST